MPKPSSATAANPISFNRDDSAPDTRSLASSTSSTNGASCTSVITACSTPEAISAERSGASNRPAACARQLPRASTSLVMLHDNGFRLCRDGVRWLRRDGVERLRHVASSPRRVPIARPALQ